MMDDDEKENIVSEEIQILMEEIEKNERQPTQFIPNWLCYNCLNSYKS